MVATVDGVTIVSVPMNAGNEAGDTLVAGTDFNATSIIDCGFEGAAPTGSCNVGVKRNWGEDGTSLVEVTRPDGTKRALFFNGTTPTGADSAQADGSAGWDFSVTREVTAIPSSLGRRPTSSSTRWSKAADGDARNGPAHHAR